MSRGDAARAMDHPFGVMNASRSPFHSPKGARHRTLTLFSHSPVQIAPEMVTDVGN